VHLALKVSSPVDCPMGIKVAAAHWHPPCKTLFLSFDLAAGARNEGSTDTTLARSRCHFDSHVGLAGSWAKHGHGRRSLSTGGGNRNGPFVLSNKAIHGRRHQLERKPRLSLHRLVILRKNLVKLFSPVTKMSYRLDDPSKAKQYFGKQVRVTGRLGLDSNTIDMETIEPRS
jgi:Protein of unknown function (DUF5818)